MMHCNVIGGEPLLAILKQIVQKMIIKIYYIAQLVNKW